MKNQRRATSHLALKLIFLRYACEMCGLFSYLGMCCLFSLALGKIFLEGACYSCVKTLLLWHVGDQLDPSFTTIANDQVAAMAFHSF